MLFGITSASWMMVARLLLCYLLLEDYSFKLSTAIPSDIVRHDFAPPNPPFDNNFPTFGDYIQNVTAASGKKAVLSCTIKNLGNFKVGWLRLGDQTILSMGEKTVIQSSRFSVSLDNTKTKNYTSWHEDEATWNLHINSLRDGDRGCYMCQLNTNPMLSQVGCVDVLVPPDIITNGTSAGEVSVLEGENATLSCKTSGRPKPRVQWRQEKNKSIQVRGSHDLLTPVDRMLGEKLELTRVDRSQMGAYLCIASNDVPPAVSKRVNLRINFPPTTKVPNQLVGSPLNSNVSLECNVEAFPKTINLWLRGNKVIMDSDRYEIYEHTNSDEEWKTTFKLKIKDLQPSDLGAFTCSASSTMGKSESTIRLHEIERPTLPPSTVTPPSWKKSNKSKSKAWHFTTVNRAFHQVSTPAMQKSTVRHVSNKMASTTTADPRAPLTKNKNALKHEEVNATSGITSTTQTQLSSICLALFLTLL